MPNRKRHQQVGLWAGASYSAYIARDQEPADILLEMIGGGIAGFVAATLPDVLEPAKNNPRHRSVCHSCLALLVVVFLVIERQRHVLREQAQLARDQAKSTDPGGDRTLLVLKQVAYRLAAGGLAGAQAGYASHLILDAVTPDSLPLLCRGF